LDLENGVLNSDNGSIGMTGFFDTITGNLNNAGTVQFGAALHTLDVTGGYTQTEGGTLVVRLGESPGGPVNDSVTVGGTASLGGTLDLTAQGGLTAGTTWTIMGYASVTGNFSTVNPPDAGTWTEAALATGVTVTKVT
jgi:subtilase-type serine protease